MWAIRRPSSRTWTWAARSSSSPRPAARSAHASGATRSVARPAVSCSTSRTSSSASRDRSRSACGHVDQPRGDQRLEDRRVPQPALGLLQVGHREVGQLPEQLVPGGDQSPQVGQPVAGVAAPGGQHRPAQPQRQVRVAGEVAYVEQPQGDLEVGVGGRQHLGQAADRVVEARAAVPQRVPDVGRHRARVDALLVDQHHVEVGARRELAAPVPPDGHQGEAGVGSAGLLVRRDAQCVCGCRTVRPVARRHRDPAPWCCGCLRAPRRPAPRSGPGPRSRRGSPTPCRRRSGRSARS